MPVRYRRNRLILIVCLCFLVFYYWRTNNVEHDDIKPQHIERLVDIEDKELPKAPVEKSSSIRSTSRPVREEIVEINGKKMKKIDWHDYDAIAREQARTGQLIDGFSHHRFYSFLFL